MRKQNKKRTKSRNPDREEEIEQSKKKTKSNNKSNLETLPLPDDETEPRVSSSSSNPETLNQT